MTVTDTSELTVRALTPETWGAFAELVERHNGVFGGCWCTWFHTMQDEKTFDRDSNRELKERLVREGKAHAALVFDGDVAVAWAEFGSCAELPNIQHRKQYEAEADLHPDYRITCIFVDKHYRHRGVTAVALHGAVELIAEAGGGIDEGYPHDPEGRRVAVLYNATRSRYEREGFEWVRKKGLRNTVMRRTVAPSSPA
jgi:GNAT superfamily N-acetyltransferase